MNPGAQLCVPLQFVDHQMRLRPLGGSGPEDDDDLDAIINDIGQGEEEVNAFFWTKRKSRLTGSERVPFIRILFLAGVPLLAGVGPCLILPGS